MTYSSNFRVRHIAAYDLAIFKEASLVEPVNFALMGKLYVLWLGLFMLLPDTTIGQQNSLKFDFLGIEEGLPAQGAYDILQDPNGFIWISTFNGLVKYDGYEFQVFRHALGDSTGQTPIGRSFITSLLGRDSSIWVSTLESGFARFNPNTERFSNYPNDKFSAEKDPFTRNELLMEDRSGGIWMYGKDPVRKKAYLKRFDPQTETMNHFRELSFQTGGQEFLKDGLLLQDQKGRLWTHMGNNGIYRLDSVKQKFKKVFACDSTTDLLGNCRQIQHLRLDQENKLWVSTDKGLYIYDLTTETWHLPESILGKYPSIQSNSIYYSYQDSKGNIWLFEEGRSLIVYNVSTNFSDRFFLQEDPLNQAGRELEDVIFRPVVEDRNGLWLMNDQKKLTISNRSFFHFNWERQQLNDFGEKFNYAENRPNESPSSFLLDQSGIMWIGNIGAGVNRQNPLAQRIENWAYAPNAKGALASDSIFSVKADLENNVWVLGKGIIQKFEQEFNTFRTYSLNKSTLKSQKIAFNTFVDDGNKNLWIGSAKDLFRFNKNSGQFSRIQLKKPEGTIGIQPLFVDEKGKLWIKFLRRIFGRDYGKALGLIDIRNGGLVELFENDPKDSTSVGSNLIREVIIDSQNRIWVGSWTGLSRYNRSRNNFKQYKHRPSDSTSISSRFISFIYEDSKSNIWIGTFDQGLNLYLEEDYGFKHWKDYSFSVIQTAIEGKDGTLWFGTERGEGLFKMDPQTYELNYFNRQDGIASELVHSIMEDEFGFLWMPSESGISRFDPQKESFKIYGKEAGFGAYGEPDVPQFAKPIKTKNGDIWLNSYTKLFRIQPAKLHEIDSEPPKVQIQSLKIGTESYSFADGELLTRHIRNTHSLHLPYYKNDLTFGFTAFYYANPELNQYSYKLEGFDEAWSEASGIRKARYAGIPPGTYTFRVRASNPDGVWNEEGASIQIVIAQAWWATIWAYLLYLILASVAVYYVIRWRTRKQAAKILAQEKELEKEREISERLKAVDQLKDQFLANTSHELRTPLNGIIGLSEGIYDLVKHPTAKEDLGLVISSGKRLHHLVDDILDFSKLRSADFDLALQPIDLHDLVKSILRMSHSAIGDKSLELKNEIPKGIPAVSADPQRLEQILYNLIGNAIKFTEKGTVSISATEFLQEFPSDSFSPSLPKRGGRGGSSQKLKISITDTGPGIAKDKQAAIFQEFQQGDGSVARKYGGTGLGLTITKQLVELHEGEIGVESEVGQGSTFWFTLPATKELAVALDADQGKLGVLAAHASSRSVSLNGNGQHAADSLEEVKATSVVLKDDQRLRILIVDDEPVNQRVIKNHLDTDRFDLAFADDGDQALAVMESSPMFDLVLLDVMMPNMSGYEVCRKIREKYLPSELPVIMVTAKNQVTDLVQGLNKGANDYLAKPFSKQEFLARVNTQIDLHHIFNITDRFIPNDFIRTLGHDRITEVQLGDLVERVVSVLFTDIRSYTSLSEAMSPEDTFRFINGYTRRMGPIIQKNQGFVNQYLGDGIMALFQHDSDDALEAMIGMQVKLRDYNVERKKKNRPLINVGMGLHTGPLIMGIIGDSRRSDAATISDTVNTAARLEGLTKGFGIRILISSSSQEALIHPEKYRLRFIGKVKVKGKNDSVGVYECIDGDPEEEATLKWKYKEQFDVGVTHYYGKKYKDSLKIMEELIKKNPLDKVAVYFYEKAKAQVENPMGFD